MPLQRPARSSRFALLAALAGAACGPVASGDDSPAPALKLTIGDKAPSLDVAHWVKGGEVDRFEPGKVYVVEFWATWCGPCRASMPQLSELQDKYGSQVTVLGISDEPLDKVGEFLSQPEWSSKTRYIVATDPDRSAHQDYLEATLQRGIPASYVVGRDGTIAWIGHPMQLDEPLAKIVAGHWDATAYRQTWEAAKARDLEIEKHRVAAAKAAADKDWPKVYEAIDALIAMEPESAPRWQVQRFRVMLGKQQDAPAAYAYGRELLVSLNDNPELLNELAWFVVDDRSVATRDLGFALRAADRANELTNGENAAILDTLARVHWEKGDARKAIELQQKAVELAGEDGPLSEMIKQALQRYQAGR